MHSRSSALCQSTRVPAMGARQIFAPDTTGPWFGKDIMPGCRRGATHSYRVQGSTCKNVTHTRLSMRQFGQLRRQYYDSEMSIAGQRSAVSNPYELPEDGRANPILGS